MRNANRIAAWTLAWAAIAAVPAAHAQLTDISDGPLAQPATSVKPNLLLILDDSGSMQRQYTPDYIGPGFRNCLDSLDNGQITQNENHDECFAGDPPVMAPEFNTQYYNPEIRYFPAVNHDFTSKPEMNAENTKNWTEVPTDAVSDSSVDRARKTPHLPLDCSSDGNCQWGMGQPWSPVETFDLANGYPDRVWCDSRGANPNDTSKCKTNSAYTYPEFKYGYGEDNSGNRKYRYGAPYYYRIIPTEYCTNQTLTVCVPATEPTTVGGVAYNVPAPVRFCDSKALTNCQAKRQGSFIYPKFLGTVNAGGSGSPGARAKGTISIIRANDSDPAIVDRVTVTPPAPLPGPVDLISGPLFLGATDSASGRNAAADALVLAINNLTGTHGYTAARTQSASGNGAAIVTITAPALGADYNGTTINVISAAGASTPSSFTFTITGTSSGDTVHNITIDPPGGKNDFTLMGSSVSCSGSILSGCASILLSQSGKNEYMADAVRIAINALTGSHGYTATGTGNSITVTAPAGTGSERHNWSWKLDESGLDDRSGKHSGGGKSGDLDHQKTAFTGGSDPIAASTPHREGVGQFQRTNIVPGNTYPKYPARTDCAAADSCSYEEEMTNFANWFAYYRTRMQMAKTAIGRAFLSLTDDFRVGFKTINFSSSHYLAVDDFTQGSGGQREKWYEELYDADANGSTPLRTALARAGRYYGDQNPNSMGKTPITKACQPNYAILTSDGYWNDSSSPKKLNGSSNIGDQDSDKNDPYSSMASGAWDGNGASNTLADTALYYYKTDLITTLDNLVPTTEKDFAPHQHMTTFTVGMGLAGQLNYDPNYEEQTTPGSGDFFDIKQGTKKWPVPSSDSETTLDDMWHAAVNGRGRFFSAQDPAALAAGISSTLNSIQSRIGAGAAAATSNLQPVAGDNFAFTAQYQTVDWSGDLRARTIDLDTGTVATRELWSAQAQLDKRNGFNRRIYTYDPNDTDTTNVVIVGASIPVTSLTQSGLIVTAVTAAPHGLSTGDTVQVSGADQAEYNQTATVTVVNGTTFTYSAPASAANVATGTITVKSGRSQNGNKLRSFCWTDAPLQLYPQCNDGGLLTQTEMDTWFNPLTNGMLGQAGAWLANDSDNRETAATPQTLIDFLRGDTTNEMSASGTAITDLYRNRAHLLGDIVNAQPAYVKGAPFSYSDPHYSTFKESTNGTTGTRKGTVYVAANDGMLHAFETDPDNNPYYQEAGIGTIGTDDDKFTGSLSLDPVDGEGAERWAYVPALVFPTMKRLAESTYSTNHRFLVDGSPVIADVCFGHTATSPCASADDWHTILVAGLNKGGRGYYALDITDPDNPKSLWELEGGSDTLCLTDAQARSGTFGEDCNIGYTFGNPIVVKLPATYKPATHAGKWVVLVTSGMNNVSPGDGKGYLYIVEAQSGLILDRLSTGVGCDASNATFPCAGTDSPSGLSRINAWVDNALNDNTALTVYGGDLKGNVWRFQLEDTADVPSGSVTLLGSLRDPSNSPQPITTRPELGKVSNQRVVFVGTGKFLGDSDKDDTQRQSFYAIKDPMSGTTSPVWDMSRAGADPDGFVKQTLVVQTGSEGLIRESGTGLPVNFATDNGWFLDFPDGGSGGLASERVNVDPILQLGTLVVPTAVPNDEECVAGGYGWLNFFDFKTGTAVPGASNGMVSTKISQSLIVGINVIKLPGGAVKTIVTTADNQQLSKDTPVAPATISGRRVSWRELIVD